MANIRFSTVEGPRFAHEGLEFVNSWRDYDLSKLNPEQQQTIYTQLGRVIQVHPDDQAKLDEEIKTAGYEYAQALDGSRRLRRVGEPEVDPATGKPSAPTATPPGRPGVEPAAHRTPEPDDIAVPLTQSEHNFARSPGSSDGSTETVRGVSPGTTHAPNAPTPNGKKRP